MVAHGGTHPPSGKVRPSIMGVHWPSLGWLVFSINPPGGTLPPRPLEAPLLIIN